VNQVNSRQLNADLSLLPRTKHAKRAKLILSIDDEAALLFTREKILQAEGYDVLSASNGEEALAIFAAQPVDLVLLDYLMPGMDGGTVLRNMKRHNPLLPVIMVSANQLPSEVLACADGYVAKGDGPAALLENIKQLLSAVATARRPATSSPATASRSCRVRRSSI
jgi:CheY-like chemotaxis protein